MIMAILVVLIGVGWYLIATVQKQPVPNTLPTHLLDQVSFSFHKVATGYPNTVIFRYDVGDIPYDSLTIQQSWTLASESL